MQNFTWVLGFTSDVTRVPGGRGRSFCFALCCAESTFRESVRKLREEVTSPAQLTEGMVGELRVRPGDGEGVADPDRFGKMMPQSLAEAQMEMLPNIWIFFLISTKEEERKKKSIISKQLRGPKQNKKLEAKYLQIMYVTKASGAMASH